MKVRRSSTEPPLSSTAVAILLGGWSCRPLDGSPLDTNEFFELMQARGTEVVRLWTQHEAWLREQAKRYGIQPMHDDADGDGAPALYFGEALAAQLARWGHL